MYTGIMNLYFSTNINILIFRPSLNKRLERAQKQISEHRRKQQEYKRIASEQIAQFKQDCTKYEIEVFISFIIRLRLICIKLIFRVKISTKN